MQLKSTVALNKKESGLLFFFLEDYFSVGSRTIDSFIEPIVCFHTIEKEPHVFLFLKIVLSFFKDSF